MVAIAIPMMLFLASRAQTPKELHGMVLQQGTGTRVINAALHLKNTVYTFKTNTLGEFTILVSLGDTLEISHEGHIAREFVVKDFSDVSLFLQVVNVLPLVVIRGSTIQQELKANDDIFRTKGIYYKGKPPLGLLSPMGGSPLTYLYERFSKDGKRARQFSRFVTTTTEYYDVSSRFNNSTIKRVVEINEADLPAFKSAYWPDAEQLKGWSDFDLYSYIKKSFEDFEKKEK